MSTYYTGHPIGAYRRAPCSHNVYITEAYDSIAQTRLFTFANQQNLEVNV